MSRCFGCRCRIHQRIMSDDSCPERDCPGGHGWTDVDCDSRCPDYAQEEFRKLLDASSFGPLGQGPGAPPDAHAKLDQFLADHPMYPPPSDDDFMAKNGIAVEQPSITCPKCLRTSYHPQDIEYGYCGNCHEVTTEYRKPPTVS